MIQFLLLALSGIALWFTRARLDVFPGPGGPTRVAMLPSLPELAGLVVLALMAGAALYARRARDARTATATPPADFHLPLAGLVLLIAPYLPWVPDWLPALRVLAGPARLFLWAIVLGQLVWMAAATLGWRPFMGAAGIFLASTVAFGAAAARLTDTAGTPGGDEPHYLIITQSLLRDHDLKIENNHSRGDHTAYFPGELEPHYLTRGVDGAIYSVHPVGLPVLVVPAFALAGYHGVVALLVLMAAAAATVMWTWVRRLSSPAAATFAWAAVCLGAPYLRNTFTVYPEIPAALCVMLIVAWPEETRAPRAVSIAQGLAAATLPWLSSKYVLMAAALVAIAAWRRRGRRADAIAAIAPFAISGVGWLAFFHAVWGSPWPTAPYGGDAQTNLSNFLSGGPGLLFDQEYGIVSYAPVLILGLTGLVTLIRDGGSARRRAIEIALVFGALLAPVGAFHIWWGGSAAPGRPLASGLLLLGFPVARQFERSASAPVRRAGHVVLLLITLLISVTLVVARDGLLALNDRDGASQVLEWLSPDWRLWALAPSFIYHPPPIAAAHAAMWIVGALAIAWIAGRVRAAGAGRAMLAATSLAAAYVIAISMAVPLVLGRRLQPDVDLSARASVGALDSFDAQARPIALVSDPIRRVDPGAIPPLMTLRALPGLRRAPQPARVFLNARFSLPAGEYRIELEATDRASGLHGELGLQVGRLGPPMRRWTVGGSADEPWSATFELPLDANFVGFQASPELAESVGELRLQPLRVKDAGLRASAPPVLAAWRSGPFEVYFHDAGVWPEPAGFWTRGRSTARLSLARDGAEGRASSVTLEIHTGDSPNRVTFETPFWRDALDLPPRVVRNITVPWDAARAVLPLRITTTGGFVPADVEPGSRDRRLLGCWVTLKIDG